MIENFGKRCEEVADEVGVELMDIYEDGDGTNNVYEDDGFLHVNNGEQRASFDVSNSQNLSEEDQNENTRLILERLGLEVTENALA